MFTSVEGGGQQKGNKRRGQDGSEEKGIQRKGKLPKSTQNARLAKDAKL
jgi:hypothetical protein